MPIITTQSIGISAAPVAGSHSANQVRSRLAATQAGIQRVQNQARASSNATHALADSKRSVQEEKLTEGAISEQENPESPEQDSDTPRRQGSTFSRIA